MPPSPAARAVADAQRALALPSPASTLLQRLDDARDPEVLLALAGAIRPRSAPDLSLPDRLRVEHAATLQLDAADLAFRRLYPGLDAGIYACSHSMGIPSVVGPAAVLDQLDQLAGLGIAVWDEGTWVEVMDRYRVGCAKLVGGDLERGDVAWVPNVSEALSAVLEGIPGGTLVYTAGHFTTGHYVHHQWAENTGGVLRCVPTEPDGSVPTERLIDTLGPEVRVLSLSHALFESGWLQDLPTLARELRSRAPEAILLVDAYQTAGTVPIDAAALGDHVIVAAGGHKQLRASAGASFVYLPRPLLERLTPRRTGWWGHAAPFAFEKGAVRRAADATRFRTGTPTLAGMAMLLGELAALGSATGGDLAAGVDRARRVTRNLVEVAIREAELHGLRVRGDWPADRRAAFVCVEVEEGEEVNRRLAHAGIRADFRPRVGGARDGWLRISGNSAGFPYEIEAVIEAIAGHRPTSARG